MSHQATTSKSAPRAPEPTVARIAELASRILSGDILLPKFQRDFVWERSQILGLLDSVARGYPIGSVLLWRSRQELRSERNIADLSIAPTQEDYPVNYLLDGQQRLSTICGALNWNGSDASSRWNLAYDLREKRFLHLDTLDGPPIYQIRLNKIPDAAAYFKHISALDSAGLRDIAILKANADELFNAFTDYKIATVTLHDMSIEAVAPIFERINSKGTPLTIVDLMRAATWSSEFDLFDSIASITEELKEKNFGGVDRKAILRSLSAAAGGGFPESSIDALRKHSAAKLQDAAAATKQAWLRAVDFMSTELHIPADNYLPYVNQAVVLAEIFRSVKSPTQRDITEIRKWFWRTAASGYFGGWNTGNMSADQAAALAFATGVREDIETTAKSLGPNIWSSQQFRSNAAHSKILVLLLSFNKPLDLLTGQRIDTHKALFHGNAKEFHHFFPRDFLISKQDVSIRQANVLANIVMLTASSNKVISNKAPSEYLKFVEDQLNYRLPEALEANLISQEAYDAALHDDYIGFIRARARTIDGVIDKLAGWS